jgi:hypothetical protein
MDYAKYYGSVQVAGFVSKDWAVSALNQHDYNLYIDALDSNLLVYQSLPVRVPKVVQGGRQRCSCFRKGCRCLSISHLRSKIGAHDQGTSLHHAGVEVVTFLFFLR